MTLQLSLGMALIRRAGIAAALALALLGVCGDAAMAQEWPTHPVKIVVPFSPGGATDVLARVYADKLSAKFGQQFIIDNRPGAGGTIGAENAAKAAPDGYTLLVYHIGMISASQLYKGLTYNVLTDFTPISLIGSAPNVVAVNNKLPENTLKALIEFGRKRPGEYNFGSSGVGGSDHLAAELLQTVTGSKFTHIPYKGGGPAVIGAISGQIQFVVESVPSVQTQISGGLLRGVAVTSKTRISSMPDVPTATEAGFPEFDQATWFGIWGPAKLPEAITYKIADAIKEIAKEESTKTALANVGTDPVTNKPEEFRKMFDAEYDKWKKILAKAGYGND
jgi:tripartite-type tricarboxylate transporter receptor subunit TctC